MVYAATRSTSGRRIHCGLMGRMCVAGYATLSSPPGGCPRAGGSPDERLVKLSRHTLLGGLAATASVAAIGQFANLPDALAERRRRLEVMPQSCPSRTFGGLRAAFLSGLSALERVAGLAPIPAEDPFRPWALASLRRVEEFYGVIAEPPGDQSWRLWVLDRLTVVERNLPAALRFPFYTHMPLDTPSGEYGPFCASGSRMARVTESSCTWTRGPRWHRLRSSRASPAAARRCRS